MVIAFPATMGLKVGDILDLKEMRAHYKDGKGVIHREGRMKLMREATQEECLAYLKSIPHSPDLEKHLVYRQSMQFFEVSMD